MSLGRRQEFVTVLRSYDRYPDRRIILQTFQQMTEFLDGEHGLSSSRFQSPRFWQSLQPTTRGVRKSVKWLWEASHEGKTNTEEACYEVSEPAQEAGQEQGAGEPVEEEVAMVDSPFGHPSGYSNLP
jgi:hypothetical protein